MYVHTPGDEVHRQISGIAISPSLGEQLWEHVLNVPKSRAALAVMRKHAEGGGEGRTCHRPTS
jgi:ribosomal protein L31E